MRRLFVLLALALFLALHGVAMADGGASCVGDGNDDGQVSVAEIVRAVRNALLGCPAEPAPCDGDADCNGVVAIAELVQAVRSALQGCAGEDRSLVVDVAWLAEHLDDPSVQIVDGRAGAYPGGHIPGAIPLNPYSLAITVDGIDFQIVGREAGAGLLGAIGLRANSTVVVYGATPEFDPARVVWALRYLGHADTRYLDGGWEAWRNAAQPIAAGDPVTGPPGEYEIEATRDDIRVTGEWILDQLGDPPYDAAAIQLVDARSDGEFAAGRIPTAVHAQWSINLAAGLLRPRAELDALYAELGLDPTRTTVVYCLSGWRASVAWMVLTWLGFDDVRVYDGSWLEWGSGGFPIEVD